MFSKLRVSQASTLFAKSNADKCNSEAAEAAAKSVAATEAAAIAELQAAKDGKVKASLEMILKDAAAARKYAVLLPNLSEPTRLPPAS